LSVGHELVGEFADAQSGLAPHFAVVRCDATGRDPEQRRLSRAVAPDQADALAGIELECCAVEEYVRAEGNRHALEALQRHARMLMSAAPDVALRGAMHENSGADRRALAGEVRAP